MAWEKGGHSIVVVSSSERAIPVPLSVCWAWHTPLYPCVLHWVCVPAVNYGRIESSGFDLTFHFYICFELGNGLQLHVIV